jgi:hypothetical protein
MFSFLFWSGSTNLREFVELYAMHRYMIISGERFCRGTLERERKKETLTVFFFCGLPLTCPRCGLYCLQGREVLLPMQCGEGGDEKRDSMLEERV